MRLAQSPRELSSPVPHMRCAEFGQLWLNPIMSTDYDHLRIAIRHRKAPDGIPEETPGFGDVARASEQGIPQFPGAYDTLDGNTIRRVGILHLPLGILLDGLHQGIGDPDRNIGVPHLLQVLFAATEVQHIRMGVGHGQHKGTPAPLDR